jgi:WD40 repeat protein
VAATEPVSDLYPLESPADGGNLPDKLGELRAWSLADPAHPRQLAAWSAGATDVDTLAVSSDGKLIATGATDGSIRVWDAANPARPVLLASSRGDGKPVYSVAFQAGNRVLASFGGDHDVRLWGLPAEGAGPLALGLLAAIPATAPEPSTTPEAMQHAVVFSADGRDLALPAGPADEEYPVVWDVSNPRAPRLLYQPQAVDESSGCDDLMGLALTGAGQNLRLVSSCGGELDVWDVIAGTRPGSHELRSDFTTSTQRGDEASGQVILERGHSIALSVSTDGIQVWQLTAAEPDGLASFPVNAGTGEGILAVNSSGPPLLADTGYLPFARLISLSDPSEAHSIATYAELNDHEPNAQADAQALGVALSGDGRLLAVSEVLNNNPVVVLRRTAAPNAAPVATIRDLSDGAISLALSRDGSLLAVADNADYAGYDVRPPAVKLFSLADPAHPALLATMAGNAFQVLFSPDGHLLVALGANIMLSWNVSDPRRPRELPQVDLSPSSYAAQGAFSADGRLLTVVDSTGALRLWQVTREDRLAGAHVTLTVAPDVGTAVALSPVGQTMATVDEPDGSDNPVVDLWNVSDPSAPSLVAQWPQGDATSIDGLAFASAGDTLVIESDQDMTVWSTSPAIIERDLCRGVGDQITPQQWRRYVPGLAYRPPCGSS